MREYEITIDSNKYRIESEEENPEYTALVLKACETYYDLEEEFNQHKVKFDEAKNQMEKLFAKGHEEYGLKKISSNYINATFIAEGKPTIRKTLDEEKVVRLLDELGMEKEDFYIEKEIKGRKASIRWGNK